MVLESLVGMLVRKEEVDHAERQVRKVTEWSDLVEEKTVFVKAACQNYEVLVEDTRAGKTGGAGPSQQYETWFESKQNYGGTTGAPDRRKRSGYRLSTEIERTTDLRKVLEERILDNKVELSLRKVLWIAKKEFHDSIVDLVKQKQLSTELEPESRWRCERRT